MFKRFSFDSQKGSSLVATRLTADDVRKWALVGAEQQLAALATEAAAIHRWFPELRRRARGAAAVVAPPGQKKVEHRRRRRRMSAGGREKLQASLKKRWAAAKKAGKTRLG